MDNPGKRKGGQEPQPRKGIPDCPDHLCSDAKAEWFRIADELLACGLLTKIDRAALAGYCQAWGRWVGAEKQLRKTGMIVKAPSGYPMQNPYLSVANKAMQQMLGFLTEFGMTPSSRTRLSTTPAKTGGKFEKFVG